MEKYNYKKPVIDKDDYNNYVNGMRCIVKNYIEYYNPIEVDRLNEEEMKIEKEKEKEKQESMNVVRVDTMKKYDYKKAVKEDIYRNIIPHIEIDRYKEKITDINKLKAHVENVTHFNDKLEGDVICYAYDEYEADEYLCHNLDLLKEAAIRLGINPKDLLNKGAIFYDWMIREYMIHYAIEDIFKDKTLDEAITLIYNIKKERFRKEE